MKPTHQFLLILITLYASSSFVECTQIPEIDYGDFDPDHIDLDPRHDRQKRSSAYRAYQNTHFLGMQTRINNQFAEFQMQAAVFAEHVHRDSGLYIAAAKTAKLVRKRAVAIFMIAYILFFVLPVSVAGVISICVCRAINNQIDACVDPPEDKAELPRLANRPAGFYVPMHRKPLIYLQVMKENHWPGYKQRAHQNYLKRKNKKNKGKNAKTPATK